MGAYPNDRSNNPLGPITYGRDFNFFANVSPSAVGVFNVNADIVITFPTQTVTFLLPDGYVGAIEYSFNGNTVHGTMDSTNATAPSFLTFENRPICKVWFLATEGAPMVRVEAWGIR